jgi:hypothetical protein
MPEHDRWDDEHVDGSRRGRTAGEDPGAYIGHEPERATETIPGGVQPDDERVSGVASQPGPKIDDGTPPAGHREAEPATDDRIREAGDRE